MLKLTFYLLLCSGQWKIKWSMCGHKLSRFNLFTVKCNVMCHMQCNLPFLFPFDLIEAFL